MANYANLTPGLAHKLSVNGARRHGSDKGQQAVQEGPRALIDVTQFGYFKVLGKGSTTCCGKGQARVEECGEED
ncbi:UNVERIFIED_CONTAM: hypothetical protein Sradi_4070800 [Sesamum radiatum]|uniref:Uncharacterized protein n=1 Tax=Sesamum radiatum TaxID=300843 RepID=A0AAW2PJ86_SESRA